METLELIKRDKPKKDEPAIYYLHHLKLALDYGDITQKEFDDHIDELYEERCL